MDALTIQAMKNRNQIQQPIRVFNKQADVDRIYGHRPRQSHFRENDDDDFLSDHYSISIEDPQPIRRRSPIKEQEEKQIRDEENALNQARKMHYYAMEEMEREKKELEKQLEEKKKLLFSSDLPPAAVPVVAPPSELPKQEKKEEAEDIMCVVCFDAKRQVLCSPCLHVVLCLECSKNLQQCPMCMAPAEMKRIFLA